MGLNHIYWQELRRKKLLEHQKSKRDDLMNHARSLATGEFDEDKEDEEEEDDMDTSSGEVNSLLRSFHVCLIPVIHKYIVGPPKKVPQILQEPAYVV